MAFGLTWPRSSRDDDGSLNLEDPPIFGDILSDPDLRDIRLIAEPWDAGGAYQLGNSFPATRWFQWNGRFRDEVRRFVRGDPGLVPALMQRLYGSDDLFPDDRMHAFHPYQSVNYVTCHDGFTLYDLVSYDRKRNHANGHNNTDGPEESYNWNCGWEGDNGTPAEVLQLRRRQAKNFCCLLLLANGTPMLRAGDEFLQTQGGNNNPYNQDNATSWLDWDRLRVNQDVFRFFRCMIRFRKAHPSLGRSRFWRDDVRWYGTGPTVDMDSDSRTLAVYLRGASQQDADLYLMINGSDQDAIFQIQEGRPGEWRQVFDTGLVSPDDFHEPATGPLRQSFIIRRALLVPSSDWFAADRKDLWRTDAACSAPSNRASAYRNPEQILLVTSNDYGFDIPSALAVVADTGYVGGWLSCRRWMETSDRCHLSIRQPVE